MTDPTPSVPAVPSTPDSAVAPLETAPAKGKGLGVFALILGLLAFVGDIVVFIAAIVQAASVISNFDPTNLSSIALGLAGFAFVVFIAFIAGLAVGLLAVLLGLIAAIRNRGRVAGIFGVIFGGLVVLSRIIVFATTGDLISQISNLAT